MNNKSYMAELMRKNGIVNLCKRWKNMGVQINTSDFLEVQETVFLQDKILIMLDRMDQENLSIVFQKEGVDIIAIFTVFIKKYIDRNEEYIFWTKDAAKLGGLVLYGKNIVKNCKFILSESEYFQHSCSIFFGTQNAEKGVCLWKGEYDYRIYIW